MKAIIFEKFGPSSVLKTAELPNPQVAAGEVLVKIAYASVNPVDWKIREGYLQALLPHRLPITPGWDFSGEVVAIGSGTSQHKVGDQVYAFARFPEVHKGSYAEMIAVPEAFIAKKPTSLELSTAAGVPLAALTAYQVLHELAQIKLGEKVLITGGAGGVGSFAIQFAKLAGAQVTATASSANLSYLRELGAENPVDYTTQKLSDLKEKFAPHGFDLIFDCVGGETLTEVASLASAKQNIISIVETPKQGRFHFVYPNGSQLAEITALFNAAKILAPATEIRSIMEAAEAQDANAKRRTRGKVVLKIDF